MQQKSEEEKLKPIDYWSKPLNKAEMNYDTTHGECLAIVSDVILLRTYLEGIYLAICTDHHYRHWIMYL